jgi:mannitol-1-phosphate/altronate dehydrogenase
MTHDREYCNPIILLLACITEQWSYHFFRMNCLASQVLMAKIYVFPLTYLEEYYKTDSAHERLIVPELNRSVNQIAQNPHSKLPVHTRMQQFIIQHNIVNHVSLLLSILVPWATFEHENKAIHATVPSNTLSILGCCT